MTNLWGVLLQTCSVSLVAGLLLGLKRVWKQTLSPRWQSALWGIGGPNFISGYYDRKVPAFAPPFLGGDVKNCG